MKILPLEWDSNLFRMTVGRIDFDPMDSPKDLMGLLLSDETYKLVYVVCKQELPELYPGKETFLKMDTRIDFYSPAKYAIATTRIEQLNDGHQVPLKRLYEMAYIAGEYSRFNRDPQFSREQFQDLYRIWVDKSVDGSIADHVLVAFTDSGDPAGMVTIKKEKNSFRIGLLAVLPEFQGRGIGKDLVRKAFEFGKEAKVEGIYVATQAENKSACNFYHSLGFVISARTHIYHYWNS